MTTSVQFLCDWILPDMSALSVTTLNCSGLILLRYMSSTKRPKRFMFRFLTESLFQDTRRAIYLIILILCCCIICQNKGQLIIRLSVRAEEKLMMNEDQVKEIIQRWVSQQYCAMATHFSWGYRTQDLLSWCCNEVWPSSVGKNSITADRLAASIRV